MVIVFVKHYLNEAGIHYFNTTWFPNVKKAISQNDGYISIETYKDKTNESCVHITLKFENRKKLDAWTECAEHDDLVDGLDDYRISAWDVAKTEQEDIQSSDDSRLKWQEVIPSKVVYSAAKLRQ